MTGIEQHSLTGNNPDGTYSVWVGKGQEMHRISESSDNFLLITREAVDGQNGLRLTLSSSANTYLVQLLASLHDYCANNGMIAQRTWKLPGEKTNKQEDLATQKVSIPLGDDIVQKLKTSFSGGTGE